VGLQPTDKFRGEAFKYCLLSRTALFLVNAAKQAAEKMLTDGHSGAQASPANPESMNTD